MSNVIWAGNKSNVGIVSIYTNPTEEEGKDLPLNNPNVYLDRIHFDTRFNYLNVVKEFVFTKTFDTVLATNPIASFELNPRVQTIRTNIFQHGLNYKPLGLLYDLDTNEAVTGTHIVQNVDNFSIRTLNLQVDSTFFILREKYYLGRSTLPTLSKKYKLLIFNTSADPL